QAVKCEELPRDRLDHLCRLDIRNAPDVSRKTGIICTIGKFFMMLMMMWEGLVISSLPAADVGEIDSLLIAVAHGQHDLIDRASDMQHFQDFVTSTRPSCRSVEMLKQMITCGMNIARLNFSHGSHEYHGGTIKNVRQAVQEMGGNRQIGIALDTKGPEIRTGLLTGGATAVEIELVKGKSITLTIDDPIQRVLYCRQTLFGLQKHLQKVVTKGSRVYVDDGLISLVVNEVKDNSIACTIENGGMLGSRKGVNLPGTPVDLPADLKFGVEQGVDMIFASFIRNADGVRAMR
ncbi:Pyruvate kinase, barrel domain protein, partial [Ostertagia ostertagi]